MLGSKSTYFQQSKAVLFKSRDKIFRLYGCCILNHSYYFRKEYKQMTNGEKLLEIFPNSKLKSDVMCPYAIGLIHTCNVNISCYDCRDKYLNEQYIEPHKEYSMKEYQE